MFKQELDAAHAVSQAIQKLQNKPNFVIQASAIGIYGDRGEEELTEKAAAGAAAPAITAEGGCATFAMHL
jgi:NAD dependent epimerase/dehydratase family enzyme